MIMIMMMMIMMMMLRSCVRACVRWQRKNVRRRRRRRRRRDGRRRRRRRRDEEKRKKKKKKKKRTKEFKIQKNNKSGLKLQHWREYRQTNTTQKQLKNRKMKKKKKKKKKKKNKRRTGLTDCLSIIIASSLVWQWLTDSPYRVEKGRKTKEKEEQYYHHVLWPEGEEAEDAALDADARVGVAPSALLRSVDGVAQTEQRHWWIGSCNFL